MFNEKFNKIELTVSTAAVLICFCETVMKVNILLFLIAGKKYSGKMLSATKR
jgi:hypothetical protein